MLAWAEAADVETEPAFNATPVALAEALTQPTSVEALARLAVAPVALAEALAVPV